MSSTTNDDQKRADELRQQGNRKYVDKDYKGAIKYYEEAKSLTPEDATIPSNLAAAFYELGMYDKALINSQRTLDLVEKAGEDPKKLRRKNLIRLARIYYMVSPRRKDLKAFVRATFKQSDLENTDENAELMAVYKNIQSYINDETVPAVQRSSRDVFTHLPRLHSTKSPSIREYYTFGHDDSTSILSHYDERARDRDADGLKITQHPKLSFFFGGCGDSRNIMMTLSDMNRQLNVADRSFDTSKIKVHMVLNDILNTSLARSLLVFTICQDLGKFSFEEIYTKKEAANLSALLYYIFVGVVLPENLYNELVKRIKALIQAGDNKQLPRWVLLSDASWKSIRRTLTFWIGDEFFTSTKWLLKTFAPHLDDHFMKELEDKVRNEQYKLGQKLSEEYKDQLPLPVPYEDFFMKTFKVLYPPDHCDGGSLQPKFKSLMQELKSRKKINEQAGKQLAHDIANTWKPNLTCIDQKWNVNNTSSNLHYDPITLVSFLFNEDWLARRLEESIKRARAKLPMPSLFDFFIQDFHHCGQCLHRLGKNGNVVLEMDVNEMHNTLAMVNDKKREALGLPLTFDRIHLSNVTDHTGYITPFTEIAQLLKPVSHSFIAFSILLNVSLWKDFNELVYSYTGIQHLSEFPKYLGFKKLFGDLFAGYTYWQPCGPPKELATKEEITQWVFNLFINFALPAPVDPRQICIINSPNNLSAIFKLLTRLNEIGYPIHWLTGILESLLCGIINTTASIPAQRIIKYIKPYMRKYNILPWQLELSTLTGLWTERHNIRINQPSAIYKVPYPGQIKRFRISLDMIKEWMPFSGGSVIASALEAVIEYPNIPNDKKMTRYNPIDFEAEPYDENIRNQLVEYKNAHWLQILSVCIWSDMTKTLDYWMSTVEHEKLAKLGCTIAVFRNDSWKVISHATPLSKATIINMIE